MDQVYGALSFVAQQPVSLLTFVLNIGKSVGFESKSSYHRKDEESGSALHPEPA